MHIFVPNQFPWIKTILVFTAIVALPPVAYPSTISTFNISSSAFQPGLPPATPCSMSGSGPGTASCNSSIGDTFGDASVTLTDNSLNLSVGGNLAGGGSAFASITHEDLYSVPVNGPISALVSLTCDNLGGGRVFGTATGHFSLGSTNVSPPVESIYMGASQGSGPCGLQYEFAGLPPAFVVSLVAMNNIVDLNTYIDGNIPPLADDGSRIFVQLTVDGFQDANGNPIAATLLTPEPGTLGTFVLALLLGVGVRGKRKLFGLRHTLLS